jgi:DNA-binding GntR family transcriptional regulator
MTKNKEQKGLVNAEKPRYRLLEPARNNGLFQEVADRLRDAILQGRFRPGERLREVELSAMLEVSRGPVREALAKLEHEGLVITRRNRGATVARLSAEDEEEVRSLRLAIERLAVQLVVRHATDADLDALQREVEHLNSIFAQQSTVQAIADFEIRFHDLLYRAARHQRLYTSWLGLRSQVHILLLSRNVDTPGIRNVVIDRHMALLGALRSRDELVAIAATEEHVFGGPSGFRAGSSQT